MGHKVVVVAMGHKAFGERFPEQYEAVKIAARAVADLVEQNYEVVVTHSNAPQVGMIHTALAEYSRLSPEHTVAPMSICNAMSQGYIGYDLQNAIRTELINRGFYKPVTTLITQVKVNPFDEAFTSPAKIIGRYMDEKEAAEEEKKGNYVIEEPGKGFRRIIASPKPLDIYEMDAIKALVTAGQVVIAGGGGGIPVLEQGTRLKGASAIIEKDLTTGKLAELLQADVLLFLTGVSHAYLNYGTPQADPIHSMTTEQARTWMQEGQFAPNSMQPKIEASISFLEAVPGKKAVIAALEDAAAGVLGKTGTVIA